jgi:lipid-A-disaccharide synthase
MKYYIIAGEASGDLHASNLMKELKKLDREAIFRCWGGDLMEKEGAQLIRHYRDLAFMGFLEVVLNFGAILNNIRFCRKDILAFHPDVIILVDYPGFNLRIARFARTKKIRVFYYISPQLWAWRPARVKIIKETVDRMFVILPFEKEFYQKFNYEVDWVGHPLLDVINEDLLIPDKKVFLEKNHLTDSPVIALLPGSRKQEIQNILGIMVSVLPDFKQYQFVIAGASSLKEDFYRKICPDKNVKIVFNQTYALLKHSDAATVTSGTATLETALIGTPQVVCYKGYKLSYMIARKIVKVPYISLVNLIMQRESVKELIQDRLTERNLTSELKKILESPPNRNRIIQEYRELKEKLGGKGASARTARLMIQYLKNIEV